jgi:hypothetical protein
VLEQEVVEEGTHIPSKRERDRDILRFRVTKVNEEEHPLEYRWELRL